MVARQGFGLVLAEDVHEFLVFSGDITQVWAFYAGFYAGVGCLTGEHLRFE